MATAIKVARRESLDDAMPNGSVIVADRRVIAVASNGSNHHLLYGCRRQILGCPTGEGYDLCDGCHPRNHSEIKALSRAAERGLKTAGADLYLWGHYGCCPACWDAMIAADIRDVYLLTDAERLFNKQSPSNVIGSQFSSMPTTAPAPETG